MTIVAYGYGISQGVGANILVDDMIIALEAQPDITIDDDVVITLDQDGVTITLDAEIDIEVD